MGLIVGHFWIRGEWDNAPVPDGLKLIVMPVPPRRVFGAGWHPSTKAALLSLEEHLVSGDSVADIGTGVGILSVAAALLGASSVFASDIYPPAEAAAKATFKANNVDVQFSTETWPTTKVDLLVCSVGDSFYVDNRDKLVAHGKKCILILNDYSVEVLDG